MRTITTTVARILFALPFALFGISHLLNGAAMAAHVPVPGVFSGSISLASR